MKEYTISGINVMSVRALVYLYTYILGEPGSESRCLGMHVGYVRPTHRAHSPETSDYSLESLDQNHLVNCWHNNMKICYD